MSLRLAYLCSDPGIPIDGSKGASVHFRELGGALATSGAQVHAFVARGEQSAVPGIPVLVVPAPAASGATREAAQVSGALAMVAAMEAHAPFDAVYERLSLFGVAGLLYARRHGVPLLVEVNAPLWEEAERYRSLHLPRAAQALALDVLDAAARVLVVSRELGRQLVACGIAADKIVVQPNGVNETLFAAAPAAERPAVFGTRPVLAFVGSLKPWHGVEFLLAAHAEHHRRFGLWVVGDGPLRDAVAAAARQHPDAVVCEGGVPHARVPSVLKAAHAAVAPYPADAPAYFCPLKVVEALALGCPLVASRVPCVTDVVADAPGVHLFDPGDTAGFAAAVARAVAVPHGPDPVRLRAHSWTSRAQVVGELLAGCAAQGTERRT